MLLAIGWGLVSLFSLPFGGVGIWGAGVVGSVGGVEEPGVLSVVGRRRQKRAQAQATEARVQRATR